MCKADSAIKGTIASIFFLLVFTAFYAQPCQAQEKPISTLPTHDKVVALTFDDLPLPGLTERIVNILTDESVTATFFLEGRGITKYPQQARYIKDKGFSICNHTNTHPILPKLIDARIIDEANVTRQDAITTLGVDSGPFFRPPYGSYNNRVMTVLNGAGYNKVIGWNIDTVDWKGNTSVSDIIHRVDSGLKPGSIILMHISCENTVQALPTVINLIKSKGYSFTDIPTYFGTPQPQQLHVPGLKDVRGCDWYFKPINYLVTEGLMSGYPDGTFKPDATISRADFVSLVASIKKLEPEQIYRGLYRDVESSCTAWPYIESASSKGLIPSPVHGDFRPNSPITAEEARQLADSILNYDDKDFGLSLADTVIEEPPLMSDKHHRTDVMNDRGSLIPPDQQKPAPRAEVAAIIYRSLTTSSMQTGFSVDHDASYTVNDTMSSTPTATSSLATTTAR